MPRHSKRYKESASKIEKDKRYPIEKAVELIKDLAFAKFDETVEIAVKLGVDPRKADQNVRGSVILPNGCGKRQRILVFAKGEKEKEAMDAGADIVGSDDLIAKINDGWLEFDRVMATPDMMGAVGKLGKILGPRGLMPNPKSGTVTFDIARVVKEIQAGKVEFKVDKGGIIHAPLGKVGFSKDKLLENAKSFLETLIKLKPASSKGQYLRSISISSTMSPGIKVDTIQAVKMVG
ncbi:MAG: 50S ribosomal protein L1 [Nitrospinae bacterium]|nr:50S ribosomal protein L1 [Nitrospinota bacterium]